MPDYLYHCNSCGITDTRIAATFEDEATCQCGAMMYRIGPVELPNIPNPCAWCDQEQGVVRPWPGVSHGICRKHADELLGEAKP